MRLAIQDNRRGNSSGDDLSNAIRDASGLYILSASKGDEESMEDSSFSLHGGGNGLGAFTYALLKGMSGAAKSNSDSYLSVNAIFSYVAKEVPRLTKGQQHPHFKAKGTDLPVAIVKN